MIRDGKRVGLHLEKEKQDRIKEINSKMSSLGRTFTLLIILTYVHVQGNVVYCQVLNNSIDSVIYRYHGNATIIQGLSFKTT